MLVIYYESELDISFFIAYKLELFILELIYVTINCM
jgi:hypothetical protein